MKQLLEVYHAIMIKKNKIFFDVLLLKYRLISYILFAQAVFQISAKLESQRLWTYLIRRSIRIGPYVHQPHVTISLVY